MQPNEPKSGDKPTLEERIQLDTVLHPGCIVAGVTLLVAAWIAFGVWLMR